MNIRVIHDNDEKDIIRLIADFRMSLASLRGAPRAVPLEAAESELDEYRAKDFPIYVAEDGDSALVGYLVCRVDGQVVWAESLYVIPEFRRQGVASVLYAEAERLAERLGSDSLYNWVDPDNDAIISFLRNRGYNVLNLLEVRRRRPGESRKESIRVGNHRFER